LDERKEKELKLVDNRVSLEIGKQKQIRKESESRILRLIDEKISGVRQELGREKKLREENEERENQGMSQQITYLREQIDDERRLRFPSYYFNFYLHCSQK
jgi:hypothetical protein